MQLPTTPTRTVRSVFLFLPRMRNGDTTYHPRHPDRIHSPPRRNRLDRYRSYMLPRDRDPLTWRYPVRGSDPGGEAIDKVLRLLEVARAPTFPDCESVDLCCSSLYRE